MLDSIKKLTESANERQKLEDEAVADVKNACVDIEMARANLPCVELASSKAQALLAEVNLIDWSRCTTRLSPAGLEAERQLIQLMSSPVHIKDGIKMWENISFADIKGGISLVDPNRRNQLIAEIRTLLQPARNADAINRNSEILREALQEAAARIEKSATSEPAVVVPGKRPAEQRTKVTTGHKIFS
jgi:hypothetical protein